MANITSFSGGNGASVTADGMSAQVENANRSYSLTEPDSNTLRFEVQSGTLGAMTFRAATRPNVLRSR